MKPTDQNIVQEAHWLVTIPIRCLRHLNRDGTVGIESELEGAEEAPLLACVWWKSEQGKRD